MAKWLVERRLGGVSNKLRSARAALAVVEEQLGSLTDDAEAAGIRAMVSEGLLDGQEHRDAQRHVDVLAAHRAELVRTIAELEQRQDALLDQLTA